MNRKTLSASSAAAVVGLVVCVASFVAAQDSIEAQPPGHPGGLPGQINREMVRPTSPDDVEPADEFSFQELGYTFAYGAFDLKVKGEGNNVKGEAMMLILEKDGLRFHRKEIAYVGYLSPLDGHTYPGYLYRVDGLGPVIRYILFGSKKLPGSGDYFIIYFSDEYKPTSSVYRASRGRDR